MNKLTDENKQYILDNWDSMSAAAIGQSIGFSTQTIINYANKENLGKSKTNQSWNQDEVNQLKKLALTHDVATIAKVMNRTENSIYLKAKKSGIIILSDGRSWTTEEETYLKRNWGIITQETIAKNLHRSQIAIKIKALKMHLGACKDKFVNEILIADLTDLLHVSRDIIYIRWFNLGLKVKRKKVTHKKSYYCISIEDLLEFLENHQDEWNSRYLEEDILGTEPEWLRQKRIRDQKLFYPKKTVWTRDEVSFARDMLLQGKSYEYIASQIGHPVKAVAYKMQKIGLQYKLKKYWKGKEIVFLQNNYPTMSMEELVLAMGRTEKAIRYKAESLGIRRLKLKK